jgi:hypothetical protein
MGVVGQLSRESYARSGKIVATCRTCGVTESFYSSISVRQFGLRHAGHDVVDGLGSPRPEESAQMPAEFEGPRLDEDGVRLAKVSVEVVDFPALSAPVFRLRGLRANGEEAFVMALLYEQRAKVREILNGGKHQVQVPGGPLYVWGPEAIECNDETRSILGLPAAGADAEPATQSALDRPSVGPVAPVAPKAILTPDEAGGGRPGDTVFPEPAIAGLDAGASPGPWSSPLEPEPREAPIATEPPERKREEPKPKREQPRMVAPAQKAPPKPASVAPQSVPPPAKSREADRLLVSKSWYIQDGEKNREEAVRISKVLSSFRWRIEPVYMIGVMLDDMLSIESSRGEITGALVRRVEEAGYRLTGVSAEQGKPVAWFKRIPSEPGQAGHEAAVEPEVEGEAVEASSPSSGAA